ncbi:RNA polymerase II subunit A [Gracilaria domingensis]|nr:RNA polymerase II subunit A [Gracilaria domingensis]
MEAHRELALRGYNVRSYGTGSSVKLPGRTLMEPVVFPFNMPYEQMRAQLIERDAALYTSNGVLNMLDRNAKIKKAPEQWRDARERFDIIITFEDRVFRSVMDDFISNRSPSVFCPSYVFNLEVKDTHADAAEGAQLAVELVEAMAAEDNLDVALYDVVEKLEKKHEKDIMAVPVFC